MNDSLDGILDYKISLKYNILNDMEYASSGNIGMIVAAHKFFELSNLFNSANFSIRQAIKPENVTLRSYLLRYAILDYNACYDYLLQIVYFAFNFFSHFTTQDEYLKIIRRDCNLNKKTKEDRRKGKENFDDKISKICKENPEADQFFAQFKKYLSFVRDKEYGIRNWANSIKHQGGFNFLEDLCDIGYVEFINNGASLFSTKVLNTFSVKYEEALVRLREQNKSILNALEWLFDYVFGDTTHINFQKKTPFLFEENKYPELEKCYVCAMKDKL